MVRVSPFADCLINLRACVSLIWQPQKPGYRGGRSDDRTESASRTRPAS
jgi:hypothetical protein